MSAKQLYPSSFHEGASAEELFMQLARAHFKSVERASPNSDMNRHFDVVLDNGAYTVDVKGMKRISRHDDAVQDDWFWIELHGVRPNDLGWLLHGQASWIAFERREDFVVVDRVALIALVLERVQFDSRVNDPACAHYRVYSRANRPDQLTLVAASDVLCIARAVWPKM